MKTEPRKGRVHSHTDATAKKSKTTNKVFRKEHEPKHRKERDTSIACVRLEVRPELVDPPEAAGLASARQEAFGSNGAPLPGPVLPDVPQQHLVLLRRPRPLPHRRLLSAATALLHRPRPPPATATMPVGGLSPRRAHSSLSPAPCRVRMSTRRHPRAPWPRTPVTRQYRSSGRKRCCRVGPGGQCGCQLSDRDRRVTSN